MNDRIIITRQMIEETFDGAAPLYDKSKSFRDSGQKLTDMLPIQSDSRILDIGCGTGAVTLSAAKRAGHVTGIDISYNMLQKAQKDTENEGLSNIEFVRMGAEQIAFPNESFDIVTCAFALFYFPRTALAEMYRVIKPGGTIGLGVFETWPSDLPDILVVLNQLIKEYREKYPHADFARFLYGWPTRFSVKDIESLLTGYDFHSIEIIRETKDTVYPDGEVFWEMLFAGGSRLTFSAMNETIQRQFKADLLERLPYVIQPDGIHLPETAIFAVGKR